MTEIAKAEQQKNELGPVHDYGDLAGVGFENQTSSDIAIPFLTVLQALSPEVDESDAKFIKGAVAGDLVNSVTKEILDKEGVFLVPCETNRTYIEYVPRDQGGGFVGTHEPNSKLVLDAKAATNTLKPITPDGNELIETFNMYCLLLSGADATDFIMPIVVSFTSTKIKVYRQLMLKMRTVKGQPPLFAFRLKMTTIGQKSKRNEPFKNFVAELVGGSAKTSLIDPKGPQANLIKEGKILMEAIRAGTAKAAPQGSNDPVAGDDDIPF